MSVKTSEIGYRAGLVAFGATLSFDIVQLLQLAGVLTFPWDEILIYGTSLAIVVPFTLTILAFHHVTPVERQFWSHAALVSTIIYAVFVTANYVVQLATIIPAKMAGLVQTVGILEQTPHSLFWDFDAVGYIAMGIASLLLVPAVEKEGFGRKVRVALLANAVVTPVIGFVYFYPTYSPQLLLLGLPWAVTAPWFMLMLALLLHRRRPSY